MMPSIDCIKTKVKLLGVEQIHGAEEIAFAGLSSTTGQDPFSSQFYYIGHRLEKL